MANTDKNIVITPNNGSTTADPTMVFSAATATVGAQNITVTAYPTANATLSFDGTAGQLLSITNSLSGTLFSVTDVSGIPIFAVDSTGKISMAPYYGNIALGASTTSNVTVTGNITVGNNIILSDTSYINTALVYDLDDMTYAADGFTNSFAPTYNQNTVTFTNPWQLLVTIDGAVQAAFDSNYDTIWFGHALTASKGYTIDTTGNIKFADCPPQGASIMARTVVGSPNPTKKVYPFKPLDIMLGI